MAIRHSPKNAALVAEAGFSRFALLYQQPQLALEPDRLDDLAANEARRQLRNYNDDGFLAPFGAEEKLDTAVICSRLTKFFKVKRSELIIRPTFQGCGFVDRSEGDILSGDTLYEVKSVERGFRSVDLYQLITYYSLSLSSSNKEIKKVGLVNPKKGVSFEIEVDHLCRQISGLISTELANLVISAISSGDISR